MADDKYCLTTESEQECILRLYKEHGTLDYNYKTLYELKVVYALHIASGDIKITRVHLEEKKGIENYCEYVVWGEHACGLVSCTFLREIRYDPETKYTFPRKILSTYSVYDDPVVAAREGEGLPDDTRIKEAIVKYEEAPMEADKFFPEPMEAYELFPERDLKKRNLDAIKNFMKRDADFWIAKGYVIADEFDIIVTTEAERRRIWNYVSKREFMSFNDYQNLDMCIALTNADRSVLFTLGYFLSRMIKRNDDDFDDIAYLLLTPEAGGLVWVKGEKFEIEWEPCGIPEETLWRMRRYYDEMKDKYEIAFRDMCGEAELDGKAAREKIMVKKTAQE